MGVHSTHREGPGLGVTPLEYTVLGIPPDQSARAGRIVIDGNAHAPAIRPPGIGGSSRFHVDVD